MFSWKMDWEKGKWDGNEMRFPQAHWNKANEAPEDHRPVGCPSWSFNLHSQKPSQQQSPQSLVLTRVSQPPRVKAHDPFPSSTCLPLRSPGSNDTKLGKTKPKKTKPNNLPLPIGPREPKPVLATAEVTVPRGTQLSAEKTSRGDEGRKRPPSST